MLSLNIEIEAFLLIGVINPVGSPLILRTGTKDEWACK